MKKVLVIASVLFASATVFGMNQQAIQKKEISGINQSKNMRDLSIKKEACKKLFDLAQSGLKENNRFSEDAKLLYSKLKFEDVWKEIEQIFFSIAPDENNSKNISNNLEISFKQMVRGTKLRDALYKFYSTEEIGKRKAKFFYKQVLGNSELGRDLYEKVIKTIDSAEYVQRSDRGSTFDSFAQWTTDKVKCFYCKEGDFLQTSVHETGHILDAHYRRLTKFGRLMTSKLENWQVFQKEWFGKLAVKWIYTKDNQAENISIFFESLLGSDRFKENLIKDYSMKYRIYEIFMDFVNESLVNELMMSYSKDQLNDWKLGETYLINDLKIMFSELKKHDKMKIYIDSFPELNKILDPKGKFLDKDKKNLLKKLFQNLNDQGYAELSQLLQDVEKGKVELLNFGYSAILNKFIFRKDSEEIEETLPRLDGIDWEKIYEIARSISIFHRTSKENGALWDNLIRILDDRGYRSLSQLLHGIEEGKNVVGGQSYASSDVVNCFTFLKGSEEKKVMLPQLDGIDWKEIYNLLNDSYMKIYSFFGNKIQSALDLKQKNDEIDLETHILGEYNAFRLIKEKGYFETLEDGKSLPIEEVMEELTKPAKPLNLTEESVEEFFEFLKTGKLAS